MSPRTGRFFFLLAASACCCFTCQQPRTYGEPETLAYLKDARIRESSGVAPSRREPGVYYTHNDSGDEPRIFKFNERGELLAEIKVAGADAADWEDIASASLGGKNYLFIGDIGDNLGRRKHVTVYRVPEPRGSVAKVDRVYRLKYPDEPRNAETLLVHPGSGDITIVTKRGSGPSFVYYLPCPSKPGLFTLRHVGQVDIGGGFRQAKLITGGAYAPDGQHVTLRTYLGAYEFAAGKGPLEWFRSTPVAIKTNLDAQGEAITYASNGRALITTSEGSPCLVSRIPLAR